MEDLKIIKELYGEKMMHLCRTLFPTILEKNGILNKIMLENFEPYKYLYDDLSNYNKVDDFKDYIFKCYYDHFPNEKVIEIKEEDKNIPVKTPYELLDEAGYILYECKNERDIQKFKKYYRKNESLCTFNGGRLTLCRVFFAVKKDVENIKREDFINPERQDKYGTSVISIQFTRGENNTLSIKNRYNGKVINPDATFSNNLDNIISGLTKSFEKYYKLNITNKNKGDFDIPYYVRANDGKFYKYNCENDNVYYCPNNVIIDNYKVIRDYQQMERYIILDCFMLDLKEKTIKKYKNENEDSFLKDLNDIKKIDIRKDKETNNKEISIYKDNTEIIKIVIDHNNNIIEYDNPNIKKVSDNFLKFNKKIQKINLPNVEEIGDMFLYNNVMLESINIPKVKKTGKYFLVNNEKLREIIIPEVTSIEKFFISRNTILKKIEIPKVKKIPDYFLDKNNALVSLNLPEVEEIGKYFLYFNETLKILNIPKVKLIKDSFLYSNENFEKIHIYEKILPVKIQEKVRANLYNSSKQIIKAKKIWLSNNVFINLSNNFIENRNLNSKGISK